MNAFVLNAGSSSFKAAYFQTSPHGRVAPEPDWSGELHWTTLPSTVELRWTSPSTHGSCNVDVDEHGAAATALLAAARSAYTIAPNIIGHRVVHGMREAKCTILDARVRAVIEEAAQLAPLHNAAALSGIDAAHAAFPNVLQAVDFDTAYHTTLAPAAAAYALPYDWFAIRGLRRYGFHGISHRYCASRTAELLEHQAAPLRMVSAHLGNGCSLAAIVHGRSVDTTMGFTPLDGLMMGSRSGSVDPGLLLYLLRNNEYTAAELDTILNTASGLRGVSQLSEDIRDVIAAAAAGAKPSQLALDIYVHRLSAAIAAMTVSTGGIDALAFTGGVGEHSAYVREHVCARLRFLGIALAAQSDADQADREISSETSTVRVVVIRAREEYAIARDILRLLPSTSGAGAT